MKKFFWMIVGATLAMFLVTRGRALVHRLTPQGIAEKVGARSNEAAAGLGDFYGTFKAASRAREAELRLELDMPSS